MHASISENKSVAIESPKKISRPESKFPGNGVSERAYLE
jgi:hypothetical protein